MFKAELEMKTKKKNKVKTSTEEVEFIYKAQNHKFVWAGFTVCGLFLTPQKQ